MTRRERLERKVQRRIEWAEKRDAKAAQGFKSARAIADGIPMGQPILVGHHSEKRHRRDIARIDSGMRRGFESQDMASHHRQKADGLERQLEQSIYSDDPDAIETLEAKATELDRLGDRDVAVNKAWRKHAKLVETSPNSWGVEMLALPPLLAAWQALGVGVALASSMIANALEYSWTRKRGPCDPAYHRANARRARERIKEVRFRQARASEAEESGGLSIRRNAGANWCTVTFAEKPEPPILEALRSAGYGWGGGSWSGYLDKLPKAVAALETPATA